MSALTVKEEFLNALLSVDRIEASEIINQIISNNLGFPYIETLIIDTLTSIGDGWETGQYALSQVYMSGILCEEIIDRVIEVIEIDRKDTPKMAIGVLLDYHALGKRIVTSVIKASGYTIIDLGYGLSVDELVTKTVEADVDILLISTLMLSSALKIRDVTEKLKAAGKDIKVIVGGAPFRFDETLWKRVGAEVDGKNATNIVRIIESLVS